MAEIINGVPIGDLPGIESVPDDSMLVVEFLGKAYHMPGAVLRQMIQDVLDAMGSSVDDVTESRLTAAIETVLSSGKYNGVSPLVEVLDEEDGTSVIHIIDAFGVKKYPVEVKGARNAVQYVEQELTEEQKAQARENIGIGEIGNSVVVELSGNPTDGYTALLSGEAVTGDELDEMAKNGSHITGVATESLVFQVSNGINGTSYTVPNGTIFSYGNAIVTGNPGFYGTGGVHSFEFRVCLQDYNFAIAYKAVANQDEKVWVSATQATHMVFRLGISQGIPAVLYGTQMLYGNSVPNMNYLYTILAESQLLNRPVFCYQVNMPFYTEDGTKMTPYSGVLFSLKINSAYQYFFEAEHEGYVYRFTVKQNEGYSCTAEPTEVYKKVQSKADDLKAEDGTLFLLSAGEPIGSGVPIPSGGTSEAVQYVEQTLTDEQKAQARSNIGAETAGAAAALAAVRYVAQAPTDTQKAQARSNIGAEAAGAAAALPAVKYEAQSLTDAQKAQARSNIGAPDDNIFIADYETTTYAEIKAAYDAGKTCFTSYDGSPVCQLVSITDAEALFICPMSANMCLLLVFTSAGQRYSTQSYDSAVRYNEQGLTNNQKAQARSNIGAVGYTAPTNVAGTEQVTAKLYTSNGGSISFGKEGPNSGTMIRLDQVDGTCRLRFRASATAGAMVWEQPEQGAQLYVDLGKEGVDKRRITFPSSAGTLALTSGNVNTATIPLGFSSRKTNGNWGNTDGTTVTCWIDPTGGGVDFRRDNPSNGKLSMKLDGRVYVNEGKNPVMGTEFANGYWGVTSPDGENNVWIRTTTQGIIPYQGGAAGAGHCSLGTANWYFANAYIDNIHGTSFSGLAAKATADANGNNIASTYLPKSGGILTDDLTVGSAKIQTNGYVIGTWLQTTAGNASSAAMQKVCVQSPDGWIYTRTLDQLRGDMGAAGAPLKVTLSGSASSGYSVDKTVSEIAAAWNAGRNVYLTDGVSIYNLSLLQGVAAASFTGIWATTLNGKSTLTVETVLVASSGRVAMYSYSA